MAQRKGAAVLQVFVSKDGEYVGTDMFSEREVSVGRDAASADLVLDSTEVSRTHAIIEHDGERVFVRDAGSTNGVYINNKKIDRAEVGRLDEVHLGDFSLKIKLVVKGREAVPEPNDSTRIAAVPSEVSGRGKAAVLEERTAVESVAAVSERAPQKRDERKEVERREAEKREAEARHQREKARPRAPEPEAKAKAPAPEKRRPAPEPQKGPPSTFDFKRAAHWEDAEELAEDAEEDERASFSMLSKVESVPQSTTAEQASVEVITVRGDSLTGATVLAAGETFWIGHHRSLLSRRTDLRERMRLVHVQKNGTCLLEVPAAASGTLRRGREQIDLVAFAREGKKVGRRSAVLRPGEKLEVVDAPHRYQIRYVNPPKLPVDKRKWQQKLRPERDLERSLGGSLACHVLVALLGIFWTSQDFAPQEQTESFAEVTLDKELKLEEPAPPPQPVQEAPAAPEPPKRMEAAPSKRPPKEGGTAKAPPGVLGLLNKTGSAAAPGPAAALAAVSNLSAANAPAGASGFRVSGLIGKLPTSDVSLGGGGGGLVTKGGPQLLRGGGGGGGQLAGKGDRAVGGQVIKMPQAMRSVGQGSLDRDAIQKVINQNVSQIQRCYERELLRTPGLSGKIEAEWVITTSGSVRSARQKFTDLASSSVVSCVLDKIKGWKFPQPKGGEVVVSYPFLFKSISF